MSHAIRSRCALRPSDSLGLCTPRTQVRGSRLEKNIVGRGLRSIEEKVREVDLHRDVDSVFPCCGHGGTNLHRAYQPRASTRSSRWLAAKPGKRRELPRRPVESYACPSAGSALHETALVSRGAARVPIGDCEGQTEATHFMRAPHRSDCGLRARSMFSPARKLTAAPFSSPLRT